MTKPVRYQRGSLYSENGVWFVRYRERVSQRDGSTKWKRRAKRLGTIEEFPSEAHVESERTAFMQKINAGQFKPDTSMRLKDFVELSYLPWAKAEHRASTYKGYREIWENQFRDRIGHLYMREIRTVHVSRMLRTIAAEKDLTKTTLQHFKSVLSAIFRYAKNEGAFDGVNPVQGAMIPSKAREPGETFAYNLTQILQILDILPLY